MWLIVGLGNPGAKYELTRHNFGFLAVDALLSLQGVTTKSGFSGQTARATIHNEPCIFLKPETFMNRSGLAVQQAMSFHKINLLNVIVIHDELDLPLGELRIKRGGGNGGHNGLKDISRLLGSDFIRIRLGIGRPSIKGIEADYVLHRFNDDEFATVEKILKAASTAVNTTIGKGLDVALQECQLRALPR